MTQKERTRKGILWMLCSLGSYGFALLQPSIGAKLHISDEYCFCDYGLDPGWCRQCLPLWEPPGTGCI